MPITIRKAVFSPSSSSLKVDAKHNFPSHIQDLRGNRDQVHRYLPLSLLASVVQRRLNLPL